MGIEMVLSLVIGYLLGTWLDRQLGSGPWLSVVFISAGVVAGGSSVYSHVRRYLREMKAEDAETGDGEDEETGGAADDDDKQRE